MIGSTDPASGDGLSDGAADAPSGQTLEQITAERDRYLEIARRTRAEFENYQKRVQRDWDNDRRYAVQPVIAELLPAIDNLDRALATAKGQPDPSGVFAGVELVRKQIEDAFAKHGIRRIDPAMSEPFNPNEHEAILQQPIADKPPMTVLQVVQPGYRLHERVVRPAQVVVAVRPKHDEES